MQNEMHNNNEKCNDNSEHSLMNKNEYTIYICQPFNRIKHIKLNKNSSISILSKIYQDGSLYIYNGMILDITKSFAHYNIKNDSKIVMISSNMIKEDPNNIDKWLRITSDQERFEEKINMNIKKTNRREVARLRDIKSMKNELKRKHFCSTTKLLMKNKINSKKSIPDEKNQLKIDYNTSSSPSNEPLPIIW